MINDLIDSAKEQLEALNENLRQAQQYLEEKESGMATEQEEYKRLKNWAEVYDQLSFEAKKCLFPTS